MAMEGRELYVHGLPTDVDHERLRDKLLIHFLRARNGGGEVTSITVVTECALITFEESRAVQSALRHHPHIIEVDGRKYELSLSLPGQDPLSLNKVILDMVVTIDCSQLQEGPETLNVLRCKFPGLRTQPGLLQQTCTLQGMYSEVQDALAYMQKYFRPIQNHSGTKSSDPSGKSRETAEKREDIGSQKQQRWANSAQQSPGLFMGDLGTESTLDLGQHGYRHTNRGEALAQLEEQSARPEKTNLEEGAECRIDETNCQDLSLIMEADVFAYLQSNKEYRRILQSHGVQVVHVTSDGVTTLFLQSEVPTGSEDTENMRRAHKELGHLYQQQESCLRKDQLQRNTLFLPGGLTAALNNVQSVLPNVLLSYDQDNIYIVGEKSEVSQAKQILLIGAGEGMISSLTEIPPSSSSSPSPSPESLERGQFGKKQSEVHTPMTPKLFGSNTERKVEAGKEYKLAARFKSSGLGGKGLAKEKISEDLKSISNKMDMLNLNPSYQSTPPIRLSFNSASIFSHELTGEGTQTYKMTQPNCTGEDVLFKNQDMLSYMNSSGTTSSTSTSKSTTSSGFTSGLTTGLSAPLNTNVNASLEREVKYVAPFTPTSVPSSKSSLRRANSFSGQPDLKEQVQKKQVASGSITDTHAHQRARSNSISGGKASTGFPLSTVEAQLTVSSVMWNYMKDAYCNQLDSVKSDMQMSEKQASKSDVSVILKGTDSSKVEESHRKLQNLVAMVASDFTVQELRLAELGLVDKDELFETCCSDVQSRFKKVILHTLMDRVFLLGPKLLCCQVSDIFKDVFLGTESNSVKKSLHLQDGVDQGTTKSTVDQVSRGSRGMDPTRSDQSENELSFQSTNDVLSNISQPKYKSGGHSTKLKTGTLERLKTPKSVKDELSKTDARENETGLKSNGQTSLSLREHRKEYTSKTLKQTNLLSHTPSDCVCGASGPGVKRTSCGVILCNVCTLQHSNCRVCGQEESQKKVLENPVQGSSSKDVQQNQMQTYQEEQNSRKEGSKDQKGIYGTMTYTEMPLSLDGHPKDTTAKIKYIIPDGIQGDNDPCPGSSFQGGVFEAYLPLNPKGQALLPCLEKAFHQGLTFTISPSNKAGDGGGKVTWSKIPHKTAMRGGRSRNGYPDSTYLNRLYEALAAYRIEPTIGKDQPKS
nr:uncharacterized protein si:busm1-163l24.3 [Misgurnus anguillicaudatus]XP_055050362.1 uncharacterized protein si:busm1-163l24.3 [Misgurnus anguillicaudatus]